MADDIVTRLRAAARTGDMPLGASFDCDAVADEIEALRAAGDALVAALEWEMSCACSDEPMSEDDTEMNVASLEALNAWQEARRG